VSREVHGVERLIPIMVRSSLCALWATCLLTSGVRACSSCYTDGAQVGQWYLQDWTRISGRNQAGSKNMQPNDPTPVVKPQATATASELDRISIEVTNRCAKACA